VRRTMVNKDYLFNGRQIRIIAGKTKYNTFDFLPRIVLYDKWGDHRQISFQIFVFRKLKVN
jgi:hypothetical protein